MAIEIENGKTGFFATSGFQSDVSPPRLDLALKALAPEQSVPSLDAAREVARVARSLGGRAFLVGGCVRDALLSRQCHDFDVEVHGVPASALLPALSERWSLDEVGESFGVVKLHHLDVDVALPRRETRLGEGHRDFAVSADPDLGPAEASARRDFTVNAIMVDPLSLEIVDPHGGVDDLRHGIMRHVSNHFSEDPLRVLRGMQFLARFPFLRPAPETVELCASMTQDVLPAERLAAEWEKLLLSGKIPSRGLEFLRECRWLRFYPELAALPGCQQDPIFHPEGDVWRHSLLALDASVAMTSGLDRDDGLALSLAALCHDFGKPATTARGEDGRLHSYGHELVGAEPTRSFVLRLWNREKFASFVAKLVQYHMRPVPLMLENAGARAWRRLSIDVGRLDLLADLVECDVRATTPPGESPDSNPSLSIVRSIRGRILELSIEKKPPEPLVMGRDLIAMGLKPGPYFGPLLSECYEEQIAGNIADRAAALDFLRARVAGMSSSSSAT